MHLRILLVEQHVEGDDDSALQWLLRADVERFGLELRLGLRVGLRLALGLGLEGDDDTAL
jgi:hypothetical protein